MGAAIRRQRRIDAALDAGVGRSSAPGKRRPSARRPTKAVHRRFAEFKIEARRRRR